MYVSYVSTFLLVALSSLKGELGSDGDYTLLSGYHTVPRYLCTVGVHNILISSRSETLPVHKLQYPI